MCVILATTVFKLFSIVITVTFFTADVYRLTILLAHIPIIQHV